MHIQGQRIFMLVYATGLLQNKLNEDGENVVIVGYGAMM